ncbi:MAG TPA: sugar phosphate nucleotidyltransferase, partial [Myxococcota bacterium]|nr:sugar phosphate nucleotidyltransferase [Myxococcota bacterium]
MSGPTARGTAPGETPARAPGPGPDPGIGLDVVLLAGGAGVRLWPVSRARRPKQFFRFQGASLLEGAWARALRLAGGAADHVWAVLTDDLAEATAAE